MAFYETKNSSVGFQKSFYRCSKDLNFNDHLQTSYELLRVKDGEISVYIENEEYRLKKGQQILIMPNLIHSYKTCECGSRTQFIIFSVDYLPEIYGETEMGIFRDPVLEEESFEIFDRLLKHRRDHFMFRAALYEIASYYERNEIIPIRVRRSSDFAVRMSEYFEKHCMEDLDEKSVAQSVGYHPRYLSMLINRHFGVSFKTLLNEYRVRMATELLQDRSKSITEIYTIVGYDSQSSFNRNFKALTGMTPREYRNENHGDSTLLI